MVCEHIGWYDDKYGKGLAEFMVATHKALLKTGDEGLLREHREYVDNVKWYKFVCAKCDKVIFQ